MLASFDGYTDMLRAMAQYKI